MVISVLAVLVVPAWQGRPSKDRGFRYAVWRDLGLKCCLSRARNRQVTSDMDPKSCQRRSKTRPNWLDCFIGLMLGSRLLPVRTTPALHLRSTTRAPYRLATRSQSHSRSRHASLGRDRQLSFHALVNPPRPVDAEIILLARTPTSPVSASGGYDGSEASPMGAHTDDRRRSAA